MPFHILLLTFAALFTLTSNAYAQVEFDFGNNDNPFNQEEEEEGPKVVNPFDDKYKPDLTAEQNTDGANLIPNFIYDVALVRNANSRGNLNFLITSPGTVTGCLDVEFPNIESKKSGHTLNLNINSGTTDVDRETVRYFHYDCNPQTALAQVGISLNAQQLIDDNIKKIVISSEQIGAFNTFHLDLNTERAVIESKPMNLERFGLPSHGNEDFITHWFYPENTIALYSTSVDMRNSDTQNAVRALARQRGLTPMEEILNGFDTTGTDNDNLVYVVDTGSQYIDQITPDAAFTLGTITKPELYFGPNGAYERATPKTIFARTITNRD